MEEAACNRREENLKLLKNGATHLRDKDDVKFYLSVRAL